MADDAEEGGCATPHTTMSLPPSLPQLSAAGLELTYVRVFPRRILRGLRELEVRKRGNSSPETATNACLVFRERNLLGTQAMAGPRALVALALALGISAACASAQTTYDAYPIDWNLVSATPEARIVQVRSRFPRAPCVSALPTCLAPVLTFVVVVATRPLPPLPSARSTRSGRASAISPRTHATPTAAATASARIRTARPSRDASLSPPSLPLSRTASPSPSCTT